MNKKEQVKEIIQALMKTKQNYWCKTEIEDAIMECRGVDPRTISNWWKYLWRLGYLEQPEIDKYVFIYSKLAELELPLPLENDPKQAKFMIKKEGDVSYINK